MEANNMAAVREALELAENELWALGAFDVSKRMAAALAVPPRNCDRPECKDIRSAMQVYRRECCIDLGPCYERREGAMHEAEWLLAPATEQKGETDGSK